METSESSEHLTKEVHGLRRRLPRLTAAALDVLPVSTPEVFNV